MMLSFYEELFYSLLKQHMIWLKKEIWLPDADLSHSMNV